MKTEARSDLQVKRGPPRQAGLGTAPTPEPHGWRSQQEVTRADHARRDALIPEIWIPASQPGERLGCLKWGWELNVSGSRLSEDETESSRKPKSAQS